MAYYHNQCDSYFVESHEDQNKRFREELRERERRQKWETQLAIAEDLSQVTSCEYRDDVLQHMETMEGKTLPDVAAIDIQAEIQWFMRPYLVDFLIEAHNAFGLIPETLFLTINLLDRYCSRRIVYKKHYQLVGCSAMLIAAKYGDRKDRVPTIKELKQMCCGLYEDDMFTQMEWHVLQTLDWIIGHPTIDSFLQMALENVAYDPEVEHMACYISEIAMFQKDFVSKRPSDMARSSLALARCILGRPQALSTEWAAKYDSDTLFTLSKQLLRPSKVLHNKYQAAHLSRVSTILEDVLARQASISKGYANAPPTPPSEKCSEGFGNFPHNGTPVTPTKPSNFVPGINNGCPTPPITPTHDEYFNVQNPFKTNQNPALGGIRRPPTPGSLPPFRQQAVPFSLPPISKMAPMF